MRLRRLETYGFKSFADRMSFDFEDGITAVVGPNGCGKSNIVDSIKWVIGEQSAKALRGSEMTDVIFNGCATRRPMSFCEVTLVLDQIGGVLGVEGDECGITRRLFRDGSSQYFINGKSCRLKDIRELFMDTGVGTAAYSVIEQGRVGFILEANTKERRLILEERLASRSTRRGASWRCANWSACSSTWSASVRCWARRAGAPARCRSRPPPRCAGRN